jgi:hypothetical protein
LDCRGSDKEKISEINNSLIKKFWPSFCRKDVDLNITNQKPSHMADVQLTAYNVKTKEKGVPIQDAVITKTAKGAYMVQGHDGKGNKLTTLCNEEKAMAAIKAGVAKQGW